MSRSEYVTWLTYLACEPCGSSDIVLKVEIRDLKGVSDGSVGVLNCLIDAAPLVPRCDLL